MSCEHGNPIRKGGCDLCDALDERYEAGKDIGTILERERILEAGRSFSGPSNTDLLNRVESCAFECEAGPLALCVDWVDLKRRIAFLNEALLSEGLLVDLQNTVYAIADPEDYEAGGEKSAETCRTIASECIERNDL